MTEFGRFSKNYGIRTKKWKCFQLEAFSVEWQENAFSWKLSSGCTNDCGGRILTMHLIISSGNQIRNISIFHNLSSVTVSLREKSKSSFEWEGMQLTKGPTSGIQLSFQHLTLFPLSTDQNKFSQSTNQILERDLQRKEYLLRKISFGLPSLLETILNPSFSINNLFWSFSCENQAHHKLLVDKSAAD